MLSVPVSCFPPPQVLDLISSDSLNVPSEEEVYRAVLSWVKHDVDSRRQHIPRVGGQAWISVPVGGKAPAYPSTHITA